jgi:hypothetical protein
MEQKIKKKTALRILKAVVPWAVFFILLLLTVKGAHAQSYLGTEWDKYIGNVKGIGPTSKTGEELAIGLILSIVHLVRNLVGALALVMGVLYGLRMVISRGQEDVISKQKANFLYALLGFMILIISENVAKVFNPEFATTNQLIDFNAARDQLRDIVSYMKWMLGSIAVLMFIVSGIRLIGAQGEENEISQQKRNITWSLLGMLTILLASNIVNAFYVIKSPTETASAAPKTVVAEVAGVIRLVLVFLGPAAIAFTIYAGFMYLTAMENEDRSKKGKQMIIAGVVAIVVIYGAYAIVNTLSSANLGYLNSSIA